MRGSEDMPVALGTVLDGKYRLERVIGRGGMGVVYEATHLHLERQVAVKVMRPSLSADKDAVARFDREARATCGLTSRHVAKMYDVGRSEGGDPYLVMERLSGATLQALIDKQGPVAPAHVAAIALDMVDALKEAHAAGIIHRDLKPANVFLGQTVKVLDFGIAKLQTAPGEGITTTGAMLGTPEFMAPEQLDTKRGVTPKSDVWSLGVTMYYALTAKTPFEAASFYELSIKVYAHEPTPITKHRADLPPELVAVINGCLQKDAKKRLGLEEVEARLAPLERVDLVIHRIEPAVDDGDGGATKEATPVEVRALEMTAMSAPVDIAPTIVDPPPPPARRFTAGHLIGAAGAVVLVLSVVFLLARRREPPAEPPTVTSTDIDELPPADPRVVAASPLPTVASSTRTPAPGHAPPRRRPPPTPKSSNGALTHER